MLLLDQSTYIQSHTSACIFLAELGYFVKTVSQDNYCQNITMRYISSIDMIM